MTDKTDFAERRLGSPPASSATGFPGFSPVCGNSSKSSSPACGDSSQGSSPACGDKFPWFSSDLWLHVRLFRPGDRSRVISTGGDGLSEISSGLWQQFKKLFSCLRRQG
ncbi:MAG TPA: hypothetical protein PKV77_07945, partial [Bacteroidales bacterium]|nr:hypothetical protein [Bacteroidales bacterium]